MSILPANSAPDRAWLARAYSYAQRDYALWTSPEHRAGTTGLARYHDLGGGPVPEMAGVTPATIPTSFAGSWRIQADHPEYLVDGPANPTSEEASALAKTACDVTTSHVCAHAVVDGHRLSAAYYRGDRAMRESGFDTSFRFGPFSGSTDDYAPVSSQQPPIQIREGHVALRQLLGKTADVSLWEHRATARQSAINRYLWDSPTGMYMDYDYVTGKPSTYKFVTTFYPLWSGEASMPRRPLCAKTWRCLKRQAAWQ